MTQAMESWVRQMIEALGSKGRRPGPLDLYVRPDSGGGLVDAERVFFSGLQLSNGTFKTTSERRLDDVNQFVSDLLPRGSHLEIIDVAVSSGVATAEWSEHLLAVGIEHRITASDLAPEAVLLTVGERAAILWQTDGHPLAVQVGSRCLYLDRSRRSTALLNAPLRQLFELFRALGIGSIRRVPLVSRRLAGLPGQRVVRDDIAEPGRFIGEFDVCRAANILNREYFADREIESMAQNLLARLSEGGLLIVCRSIEEGGVNLNRATVVRKTMDGGKVVARLNGGADVEDLLLGAGVTSVAAAH